MSKDLDAARRRQPWHQPLTVGLLMVLLVYTLLSLASGLRASQAHLTADLMTRAAEFAVFREGIYPMRALLPAPVPGAFPTSVYPPYAQVMFAAFFGWGGASQAWLMVHGLSLLSLGLIGWIGWRCLRFAGVGAGLLGALAPVAISGNGYSLFQGQFSILCMGLISLQWLLLLRRRPLPAALCWAAAMLKPQIAITFAIPFLRRGSRRGLILGCSILLFLSAAALAYTHVSPVRYLSIWLKPGRLSFVEAGNVNLMFLFGAQAAIILLCLLGLILVGLLALNFVTSRGYQRRPDSNTENMSPESLGSTLRIQGLCAIVGCLSFYHHPYDNIMLYPALLAIFKQALSSRKVLIKLTAILMAYSLWMPVYLVANNTFFQKFSAAVWLLVGLCLLLHRPCPWGPGPAESPPSRP